MKWNIKLGRLEITLLEKDDRMEPSHKQEVWVQSNGDKIEVNDMTARHAKHTLALILRNLRNRNAAVMAKNGRVMYGKVLTELIDDQMVMVHGDQIVPLGFYRRLKMFVAGSPKQSLTSKMVWHGEPNDAPIERKES